MTYVIYNTATTIIPRFAYPKYGISPKHYATKGAAKAALTRAMKKGIITKAEWFNYSIAEADHFYANIEKTRIVKNMMSGKEVEEPVNTPNCCSVASETYWSM